MKGKTVSITIPLPLFDYYEEQAKEMNASRSKVITTILINDFVKRKELSSIEIDNLKQEGE